MYFPTRACTPSAVSGATDEAPGRRYDVPQDGLTSRGAAPPRSRHSLWLPFIQPLQDTKRCRCPSACSYTFGFVWRRNVLNVVSFSSNAALLNKCSTHGAGGCCLSIGAGAGVLPALPGVLTDRSGIWGWGWGPVRPSQNIDGSKRRAGPRLGSNGCWQGAGGSRVEGIPGARAPTGLAAEHHPSILLARGMQLPCLAAGLGWGRVLHGECLLNLDYVQDLERCTVKVVE